MEKKSSEKEFFSMLQATDISMETIRGYLQLKIINAEDPKNRGLLEKCPYIRIRDMAAVPVLRAMTDDRRIISAFCTESGLPERLGMSGEEFLDSAIRQAAVNNPATIRDMSEFIPDVEDAYIPMYIATTDSMYGEASVIAYPGFFKQAKERLGENFLMFPSSVHEVILLKESAVPEGMDIRDFGIMVEQINNTSVPEEERLTDNAYHYDVGHGLETVDEYWERSQRLDKWHGRKYGASPGRYTAAQKREDPQEEEDEEIDF